MSDKLFNVKVFVMVEDEEWKKLGTGQISSKYIERLQGVCLLVHSESDGSLILECKIDTNVSYQKQEDIIIWSEAKNHGMAIHFDNQDDCQEIWKDICQVHGKDSSVEITQELLYDLERFEEMPQIWNLDEMPKCELGSLENIAYLVTSVFDNSGHKEKLAMMLENEEYIKKLLQLFHVCESQQNTEALHYLHNIIKGILFLNKTPLFDIMFSDECILDVVGCLEYDPFLDQPKQHRQFLTQNANFKEVMPITHSELREKIHQTYRVQYIYDILLPTPSILEENLLSNLKTFIFFNKIEIVTMLQEDELFLSNIFAQLKDETTNADRRHELILFFKEFCVFSQTLQSKKREALLKIMVQLGIIPILKVIILMNDYQIKVAAIDILGHLVEYNPHVIQKYAVEEAQKYTDDDHLLINIIIAEMICDAEPEFSRAVNLEGLLHFLLDPENILNTANGCEGSEFLNFFYARCMHTLIAPLLSIAEKNDVEDSEFEPDRQNLCPDNYQTAQMLSLILELLTFCVQYHTSHIKNCILSKNLLKSVLVLTSSKHTFLILGAVRFMRKMIGHKDEIYNCYIINRNLFEPVVKAFLLNGSRYNMLNSAIIELFEFIREENIKSLVAHIVEKFFMAFESTEYVQTFKGLKINYEEEKKRENKSRINLHSVIYKTILCRHIKVTEVKVEEEMCSKKNTQETAISSMEGDLPGCSNIFMKTTEKTENENKVECPEIKLSGIFRCSSSYSDSDASTMSRSRCSPTVALVDYSDDDNDNDDDRGGEQDEEKEDDKEDQAPPCKRPYISL